MQRARREAGPFDIAVIWVAFYASLSRVVASRS